MLKIVKNNTNIEELKNQKYVFYTQDFGGTKPQYGKIGFTAIVVYLQGVWEYKRWKRKRGA